MKQKNVNKRRLTPYYRLTNGNPTNNDDEKSKVTTE